jgi:WD40 repeat protein
VLAFSGQQQGPDGSLFAAAAADHTINLWNVAEPGSPGPSATLSGLSTATGVAFVPGAHALAAAAWDGAAQLWNINPDQVAQRICAFHRAVAPTTLATYLPGVPYQPICPAAG